MQSSQHKTFEDIAGWFDYPDVYAQAVEEAVDGAVFVEVGSFLGKSACFMAEAIRRSGKRIALFCVDHFRLGDGIADVKEARDFLASAGGNYFAQFVANTAAYRDIVVPVCGDSPDAAKFIPDQSADFIFIDASHDEESVGCDIEAWSKKLKPGGMIAGHDYDLKSVRLAVDAVFPVRTISGRCWLSRPFDDLFIFAQQFSNGLTPAIPVAPHDAIRKVGSFTGITLLRSGPYQVQLWIGEPNAAVEDHKHPNVDTVQVYVSGQIYLKVNGIPITAPDVVKRGENGATNFNGRFTRIHPEDAHSFTLGPLGGSWLTVEKWLNGVQPTSTELDWEGPPINDAHAEELAA